MCWWVSLSGMVLVSSVAASDFVCGPGPRVPCAGTVGLTQYHRSVDPATMADPTCTEVPPEPPSLTQAQRALIHTVAQSHPYGRCHLKVVGGLAVEMTQGEKDAVNAAIQVVLDDQQAYEDAVANNDLCSATLAEIRTRKDQLDAALAEDIAAITNIATAKTELADMMNRLTGALLKLMECIRGRAGPPQ